MADWLRPAKLAVQILAPAASAAAASPDSGAPQPGRGYFEPHDPARRLAHLPASLEKFRSIIEPAENLRLLTQAIGDEIEFYRAEESRLHSRISELRNWAGGDATTAINEAEAKLASVRERLTRERRRETATGYMEARPIVQGLSRYLEDTCRSAVLSAYEGQAPAKLQRGESPTDGIERMRGEVAGLVGQIEQLETVTIPADEAYRIGCAEIDELARSGSPSIVALLQFGGRIGWPESTSWATGLNPAALILPTPQIEALAVNAWHGSESMKAQLRADIEKLADKNAMMPVQKAERRAALLLKKLQLERAEEAVIESMPVPIARRVDADPRSILLLSDDAPAPGDAT